MIEARIDETCTLAFRRLFPAGDIVEEIATVFGGVENEGGRQEDGRLDRTFGEFRIIAIVEHLGFRMQGMIADMGSWRMRCSHGTSPSISGFPASTTCLRLSNIWSAVATEKHPSRPARQICHSPSDLFNVTPDRQKRGGGATHGK